MKGYFLLALLIVSFLLIGLVQEFFAEGVHEMLLLVFIVFAAYWYPRQALLIAVATAAVDLFFHLLVAPVAHDFFEAGMIAVSILVIGTVVGWLRIEGERHEHQYRTLFSSMSGSLILLMPEAESGEFIVTDINPVAESLFRVTKSEAVGKAFSAVFSGFNDDHCLPLLNEIKKTGGSEVISPVQYHNEKGLISLSCNIFGLPNGEIAIICQDISEEIEVSEALRASEQWYRTLLDALNEGIWVVDNNGVTTFVNPVTAKMLGYSTHEMVGRPFLDFLKPDTREMVSELWMKTKADINEPREFTFLRKDGSPFEVVLTTAPLIDINGNFTGSIAGVLDISLQQELFRKLQQSESYYKALFTYSAASTLIVDRKGVIVEANPEFLDLTGFSCKEAIGQNIFDYINSGEKDKLLSYMGLRRVAPGSAPTSYQVHFIRKDGQPRTVMVHAGLIPGTEFTIASVVDVTRIEQVTTALHQSEERYREIALQAQEVIWEVDTTGSLLYINPLSMQVLGYSPEEIMGNDCRGFLDPAHGDEYISRIAAILDTGKSIHGMLLSIQKKDGSLAWLKVNMIPVYNGNGVVTGYRGSAIDVTGEVVLRAQQEKSLHQIEINLYQLARLNDEIRNPLAVIVALADMEGGPSSEKIIEQSMKIDSLIRDIDIAWVESVRVRDFLKKYYGIGDVAGEEKKKRRLRSPGFE